MTYGFLGMEHDEILRGQSKARVKQYQNDVLGWTAALEAARRFSDGRQCSRGIGTGLKREAEITGTFNVCYWVDVEGTEWVVRFPLMGMISDETTLGRMRSEVATLKFLRTTMVPVPAVIGYYDGNEFPPFMILESIDGIRMNLLWAVDVGPSIFDRIAKDLARIQLELLSYPSNCIAMLSQSDSVGPYSIDAMEHERDGVFTKSEPLRSARTYYNYKRTVWKQRLEDQRNGITSFKDGVRKLLNDYILEQSIDSILPCDDEGPFYLVHPDLQSSNIILDRETFHVKAIIDWEGACFLPLASSCIPPKALSLVKVPQLSANSKHYDEYKRRATRYVEILSQEEKNRPSTIAEPMATYLADDSIFLIWALDDVRYVDTVVWQHLAPRLYPDLLGRVAEVEDNEDAVEDELASFAKEHLIYAGLDPESVHIWIMERLGKLSQYDKELDNQ